MSKNGNRRQLAEREWVRLFKTAPSEKLGSFGPFQTQSQLARALETIFSDGTSWDILGHLQHSITLTLPTPRQSALAPPRITRTQLAEELTHPTRLRRILPAIRPNELPSSSNRATHPRRRTPGRTQISYRRHFQISAEKQGFFDVFVEPRRCEIGTEIRSAKVAKTRRSPRKAYCFPVSLVLFHA